MDLSSFVTAACSHPGAYCRIRTGATRRGAAVAVSKIWIGDPVNLDADLARHLAGLAGEGGGAWIEVLEEGGSTVLETSGRIEIDEGPAEVDPAEEARTGLGEAFGRAMVTIERLCGSQIDLSRLFLQRSISLEERLLATVEELSEHRAIAAVADADHRTDHTEHALATLAPLAYAAAERMGLPVKAILDGPGPRAEDPPPDGSDPVDEAILDLVTRADQDPGILTDARMRRLLQAGIRAKQRQGKADPAP